MKLFTLIIGLLLTSFTYGRAGYMIGKIDLNVTNIFGFGNVTEACIKEYYQSNIVHECVKNADINNYKKVCAKFNSKKCQNFFKDIPSYLPTCKKDENSESFFKSDIFTTLPFILQLYCAVDEYGNNCPITEIYLKKKQNVGNTFKEDTCKSKACSQKTYEIFNYISQTGINVLDSLNLNILKESPEYSRYTIDTAAAYFKSEECEAISLANEFTNTLRKIKMGSTLLVSFVLTTVFLKMFYQAVF